MRKMSRKKGNQLNRSSQLNTRLLYIYLKVLLIIQFIECLIDKYKTHHDVKSQIKLYNKLLRNVVGYLRETIRMYESQAQNLLVSFTEGYKKTKLHQILHLNNIKRSVKCSVWSLWSVSYLQH